MWVAPQCIVVGVLSRNLISFFSLLLKEQSASGLVACARLLNVLDAFTANAICRLVLEVRTAIEIGLFACAAIKSIERNGKCKSMNIDVS